MTIKKYNQIILAIGGTILTLTVVVFLVIFLNNFFQSSRKQINRDVISQEETNKLSNDTLRKQIISLKQIHLLDSTSKIYIVPVTQANLDAAESSNMPLGLINSYGRTDQKLFYGRSSNFNNIVLFNSSSNSSKILFADRLGINDFRIISKHNNKYLFIIVSIADSNNDTYINSKDLQKLFVYDLKNEKLTNINLDENESILELNFIQETKDLICVFGIDRNKNGVFDNNKEPKFIKKFNFHQLKFISILEEKQIDNLQKLLEGN